MKPMINSLPKYYDTHLHSCYSFDSEADPEDEIKHAKASGLTGMCFTDHNDFDYRQPDGSAAFALDFDEYINALTGLREKHAEDFEIMIGLEQGLTLPAAERIDTYDPEKQLDFIIGSTHVVDSLDPYYPEFWDDHDAYSGVRRYYENIYDCVNEIKNFDVYGHLDYITRYLPKQYKDLSHDELTPLDLVCEILKKLIYDGKGIEINTAGWKKGNHSNPSVLILREYKRLGGEIITTGSDAHCSAHIGDQIKKAHSVLSECGFKYACVFKKRKPGFYNL